MMLVSQQHRMVVCAAAIARLSSHQAARSRSRRGGSSANAKD